MLLEILITAPLQNTGNAVFLELRSSAKLTVPQIRASCGSVLNPEGSVNRERIKYLRNCLEIESTDSFKLSNDLEDNPICSVRFDERLSCICVTWKQHATRNQLQFVHESILQLLKNHGVSKVLGDDTALPTIHAEDQSWIVENWIPRAVKAGLKAAASKSPNSHFGRVSVNAVQSKFPSGLVARSFENLDDAKHWIQAI